MLHCSQLAHRSYVDVIHMETAHAKLERRDFSNEEGKEAELLAMEGSDDGMLAEVFADAPLM
ncbi:hypothetical protein AAZX31_19G108000 [Glycine max]